MAAVAADPKEIRDQVEKILASSAFAHNERLGAFLRFVVEQHLVGQAASLKETVIGVEVYGRKADYQPKIDSIVRTEAARLRSRLTKYYAEEGVADRVIIDLPKGGYGPVVLVGDGNRITHDSKVERHTSQIWTWRKASIAIGLLFVAGAIAIGIWWGGRRTPVPAPSATIAVLPFKNLSPEPDTDYFSDGLTDEIIRNLSIIEGLEVRSRTSSFAFKEKPRNIKEIGDQLKVNYLLEGSVLRDGGNLRVNAQFIRVADDATVWTKKFDLELKDVFDIQDEISLTLVNELRLKIGHGRRRYETSVEAYDLYLRALSQSNLPDRPGLRLAKENSLYEEVIAKDPVFAPAYARLARNYATESTQFPLKNPEGAVDKLRLTAEKAIQLDPLLVDAQIALAMMHARDGQWIPAEKAFREALRLDPNRAETYAEFSSWILEPLGRINEAIDMVRQSAKNEAIDVDRQSARTDLLSRGFKLQLATLLISIGRYDEADSYIKQAAPESQSPASKIQVARLRLCQGRDSEAIAVLESYPEMAKNPLIRGWLGHAYARSGRRQEAEKMAAASEFDNERALIYAGLGDKDRTLAALERMGSRGPQRVGRLIVGPEFDFLRDDPRMPALRKNVRLP